MSQNTNKKSSRWPFFLFATSAILVIGVAGYFLWPTTNYEQLVSLKNTGVGHLENEKPAESIAAFTTIARQAPEERLGVVNLAIARLMLLQQTEGALAEPKVAEACASAKAAIERMISLFPDDPIGYILAARMEFEVEHREAAIKWLNKAVEKSPDNPAIHYELYSIGRISRDPEELQQARASLAEAHRLAPKNMYVLLDHLDELAATNSEELPAALKAARDTLAPLESSVQRNVRVSLAELLSKSSSALEDNDPNAARRFVRMANNISRPEAAVQSDRLDVELYPLEFAEIDFSSDFYTKHALARSSASDPIEVAIEAKIFPTKFDRPIDCVVCDFDLSGSQEIAILVRDRLVISKVDLANEAPTMASKPLTGVYHQILTADLDSDVDPDIANEKEIQPTADIDFVLAGEAGVLILENQKAENNERQLVEVEQAGDLADIRDVAIATLGDFDHDGDLDLFVAVQDTFGFYSNRDGLHFEKWKEGDVTAPQTLKIKQAIPLDWDRDTDLDLLVVGEKEIGVLENLKHGRLRWRSLSQQFETNPTLIEVIDADANASWDILLAGDDIRLAMTQTSAPGKVVFANTKRVASFSPTDWLLFDYDNDGLQDILAWNSQTSKLFRNLGNGDFQEVEILPDANDKIRSAVSADVDDDGDLDLVLSRSDDLVVWVNNGGNANAWIDISLIAQQVKGGENQVSGRVNQYGLGSLIELKAGAAYQSQTIRNTRTHFGLGPQKTADVLRVVWTNGIPDNVVEPPSRTAIYEMQQLKGSCPYLYAWSGEGYEFVTDLLWAAPIGLQTAGGDLAPAREWEYLKISGEALKPHNGEYRLQITEELWEAAYFDQVELIAIDHPAETEIYTNEKVGPAFMAEHRIFSVDDPRQPVSATDASGRDLLPLLAKADDRYAQIWQTKIMQGYTEPHFLQLDLGEIPAGEKITLFLTGWVYPTDTSINMQLAKDPQRPGPRPPSLQTQNEQGEWVEVIPFTGFPGGKTKTIAVDITDAFKNSGESRRLRLVTSMEIYWDAAFFTVGEQIGETNEQTCKLVGAKLWERGFSARTIHPQNGPERYDYSLVSTDPRWPPMQGRFTRLGDVSHLVNQADDLMVVMGAGDAMELRFAVPAKKTPPGWKRDFVLHNVGYDKDADLNTVLGSTVEPLPFRAMKSYPPATENPNWESESYQKYLRNDQTRVQDQSRFRRWIRSQEQ